MSLGLSVLDATTLLALDSGLQFKLKDITWVVATTLDSLHPLQLLKEVVKVLLRVLLSPGLKLRMIPPDQCLDHVWPHPILDILEPILLLLALSFKFDLLGLPLLAPLATVDPLGQLGHLTHHALRGKFGAGQEVHLRQAVRVVPVAEFREGE